mmetsp:Transcript_3826/g.9653  ORF Transcript_3826/g.9653 Transcript_3826/m.9653 type:complete len:353 (+) Transcript_3826:1509-2567(+)
MSSPGVEGPHMSGMGGRAPIESNCEVPSGKSKGGGTTMPAISGVSSPSIPGTTVSNDDGGGTVSGKNSSLSPGGGGMTPIVCVKSKTCDGISITSAEANKSSAGCFRCGGVMGGCVIVGDKGAGGTAASVEGCCTGDLALGFGSVGGPTEALRCRISLAAATFLGGCERASVSGGFFIAAGSRPAAFASSLREAGRDRESLLALAASIACFTFDGIARTAAKASLLADRRLSSTRRPVRGDPPAEAAPTLRPARGDPFCRRPPSPTMVGVADVLPPPANFPKAPPGTIPVFLSFTSKIPASAPAGGLTTDPEGRRVMAPAAACASILSSVVSDIDLGRPPTLSPTTAPSMPP